MNRPRYLPVIFGLALAAPAAAQDGTWAISGAATYVAHYEGHTFRGTIPFAVTATLAADGTYEVTAPVCPGSPPSTLTGQWTAGSNRALPTIIRRGIRANLTSCAIRAVRVRDLSVRQRTAEDGQSLGGGFTATVRYRYNIGGEFEAVVARVHGQYAGTRASP